MGLSVIVTAYRSEATLRACVDRLRKDPAVRQILLEAGFEGWCTVEQDCDPTLDVRPMDDAKANRDYLASIGF